MKGFKNETQVICTVLAHDLENDPDIVAMVGTSAALCISGVPFLGPIGGCRVGYKNGAYVLNPLMDEVGDSELDLIVAGTQEGVLMVESMASELSEEVMLGAVTFGHDSFQPVIQAIIELAEACAKDPMDLPAAAARHPRRCRRGWPRPARPISTPPTTSATSPSATTRSAPPRRRRWPPSRFPPRSRRPRAC